MDRDLDLLHTWCRISVQKPFINQASDQPVPGRSREDSGLTEEKLRKLGQLPAVEFSGKQRNSLNLREGMSAHGEGPPDLPLLLPTRTDPSETTPPKPLAGEVDPLAFKLPGSLPLPTPPPPTTPPKPPTCG